MRLLLRTFLASTFRASIFLAGRWVVEVEDRNDVTTSGEGPASVGADGDIGGPTDRRARKHKGPREISMTDKLAGKYESLRILGYVESVDKQSLKVLEL